MESTPIQELPGTTQVQSKCWFCEQPPSNVCQCRRSFCGGHTFEGHCLICALGMGLYEKAEQDEPVSGLLLLSLVAAANDPYVVVPPRMQGIRPLPLPGLERTLRGVIRLIGSSRPSVRLRAAVVLAATTNSWPTMDPSQLAQHRHGTGLLAVREVRTALLEVLKQSRTLANDTTGIAILDKLRSADFRDLYPSIAEGFQNLRTDSVGGRVHDMFAGMDDIYPSNSYAINERCELFVYEQFINRKTGAGAIMERMYGPKLRYAPGLARMLKKGVWHSSYARFTEWYPGEDEPY
jgi:hypothetical protein